MGTVTAAASVRVRIAALANPPDRSSPRGLGTNTSTSMVRVAGSTEGLMRATVPVTDWVEAAVVTATDCPMRTSGPNRSGIGSRSFRVRSMTSLHTSVPARIIVPSLTLRAVTA